jgi:hypothetical protein
MAHHDQNGYEEGRRAARNAVANGVPRWLQTTEGPCIHPDTGLPVTWLSSPGGSTAGLQSYVQGFNDEILAAIEAGAVAVDFRPLLMSRAEIQRALDRDCLGTLSPDNPRIRSPGDDFVIQLRPPWILYSHTSGGRWPKLAAYDGPVRIALGRDGHVLVFETRFLYLTRDVLTTQVLNRYLLDADKAA